MLIYSLKQDLETNASPLAADFNSGRNVPI